MSWTPTKKIWTHNNPLKKEKAKIVQPQIMTLFPFEFDWLLSTSIQRGNDGNNERAWGHILQMTLGGIFLRFKNRTEMGVR